jgi:aminoglycoside 6'-N-acetyltransferase I
LSTLEAECARRGASMLWLGTDDENRRTSIGGIDLYPDALAKLHDIRDLRGHPFEVYQKLGFEVVGVLPDANGFGKPDILMAKRLSRPA